MKTALITGGNKGIGFEICQGLDKQGWQVILCARDLSKGQQAAHLLSSKVRVMQLDVTDEASMQNLYLKVKEEIGTLDVLINNAGVGPSARGSNITSGIKKKIKKNRGPLYKAAKKIQPYLGKNSPFFKKITAQDIAMERVREIMETNFYGPWRMIQLFIPLLQKSENPRIINISSESGALHNLAGMYPGYSLSKTALNALTILFSNELKDKGIRVNAVCPGWVKTDMGGPDAPRTPREGADTAIWLATTPQIGSGTFYRDRKEIQW